MKGAVRSRILDPPPLLSYGGILLAFLAMAVLRALLLDSRMRALAACRGCMALLTLQHDAGVLGVVLLAFGVAHLAKARVLRRGLKAFICIVIVLYGLDLLTVFLYDMRLIVEDFLKYGREVGGVLTIARHMLETPQGIGMLLGMLLLVAVMAAFLRSDVRLNRKALVTLLFSGFALLAIGLIPTRRVFAHSWAYRNVFGVNLDREILSSYSGEFTETLLAEHRDLRIGEACSPRPSARPDIVMVVLEGFSMYHSRFFSGLADNTPNLDRIASNHTAFTRFWANGFTTENGLLALLGGQVPLPRPDLLAFGGGFAFEGSFDLPGSLPRRLEAHGYHTAFLTTGDLAFSGKGAWLEALGFDELWGHDDPFYAGWPRLHFSAAPDSALYARALRWLEDPPSGRPFFLVLETVSSHHPFIEPETRTKSEEAVFRYADRQLGFFYDALVARGWLDSTLFVVASDHRTMTPVRPHELELFGEEARALVPFIIADPAHPGARRIEERYQQVDLATSIGAMLT
ncbi:MAG: LTA synthase family protein, partial [Gemmatimonadota bacterium]